MMIFYGTTEEKQYQVVWLLCSTDQTTSIKIAKIYENVYNKKEDIINYIFYVKLTMLVIHFHGLRHTTCTVTAIWWSV